MTFLLADSIQRITPSVVNAVFAFVDLYQDINDTYEDILLHSGVKIDTEHNLEG
jgi:hypothetical protein